MRWGLPAGLRGVGPIGELPGGGELVGEHLEFEFAHRVAIILPEVWCQDAARCRQAGVPEAVDFPTKPEIAVEQIRQAMERQVPVGVVLADPGNGKGTQFR